MLFSVLPVPLVEDELLDFCLLFDVIQLMITQPINNMANAIRLEINSFSISYIVIIIFQG